VSPAPDLAGTLQAALTAARRAQDKPRLLVLGSLLASLKYREIELARDLTDADVVDVLRRGIKTRGDSVEQFEKAGRAELAADERGQIAVIQSFLPADVDPEEIRAAVRTAMTNGATDIGKVMAAIMPALKGKADGKVINQVVREELAKG
jgi:uncharacterized protein YqeY